MLKNFGVLNVTALAKCKGVSMQEKLSHCRPNGHADGHFVRDKN